MIWGTDNNHWDWCNAPTLLAVCQGEALAGGTFNQSESKVSY